MWVAVVEDQEVVGHSLARRLRRVLHVPVRLAADLPCVLGCISEFGPPGVLVLDHGLAHGVTGASVLAALRRRGVRAPCAFWTSGTPHAVLEALRAAGVDERPPCFAKDGEALLGWVRTAAAMAPPLECCLADPDAPMDDVR